MDMFLFGGLFIGQDGGIFGELWPKGFMFG